MEQINAQPSILDALHTDYDLLMQEIQRDANGILKMESHLHFFEYPLSKDCNLFPVTVTKVLRMGCP